MSRTSRIFDSADYRALELRLLCPGGRGVAGLMRRIAETPECVREARRLSDLSCPAPAPPGWVVFLEEYFPPEEAR